MSKPLGEYKQGGKSTLPEGHYVLRLMDVKVVVGTESGACYAVLDLMAVRGEFAGQHTEIGVSFSDASEGIAAAWCYALGYGDDDCPPKEDAEDLEAWLKAKKGALVECDLGKSKNNKGYMQNSVNPPWEVLAADAEETDLEGEKSEGTVPF